MGTLSLNRWFLCLIMLVLAIDGWQYQIGIRLMVYDLAIVFFVSSVLMTMVLSEVNTVRFLRPVRFLLFFWLFFFFLKVVSVVGIFTISTELHPEAISQYVKGIGKDTLYLMFVFCLAYWLSLASNHVRTKVLNFFIAGVLLSAIYQILSILMVTQFNLDLDQLIWPALTLGAVEAPSLADQAIGNRFITLYRKGGFSINPNVLASQLATVIPFLLLLALRSKGLVILFLLVALLSLALTLSRSGFLATGIGLATVLLLEFRYILKRFKVAIILLSAFLGGLLVLFGEALVNLFLSRFDGVGLGTRGTLNEAAFDILWSSPLLGVGHNVADVVLSTYPIADVTGADLHSFWLTKAVEVGLVGLLGYLVLHIFILVSGLRSNNIYGKAMVGSLLGLSASGFFNNALASVTVQTMIVLLFLLSQYESNRGSSKDSLF